MHNWCTKHKLDDTHSLYEDECLQDYEEEEIYEDVSMSCKGAQELYTALMEWST